MSSPRNPRYFPRMKVRGARRRSQAPIRFLEGAFDQIAFASVRVSRAFEELTSAMQKHQERDAS